MDSCANTAVTGTKLPRVAHSQRGSAAPNAGGGRSGDGRPFGGCGRPTRSGPDGGQQVGHAVSLPATVVRVRLTYFRELMDQEFGPVRAASLSRDHVFAELGGRTVEQALEHGIDAREIWRVVCDAYEVPLGRR